MMCRFCALLLFTLGSFIYWLSISVFPQPSRRFISRHLEMSDMPFDAQGEFVEQFGEHKDGHE